ncbi:membrane protein insertase YidC [uncultured Actinomyces sp.]|uniref:membrane protein insertase YidC n=1 Tax=uncultured Actinomyces sp. TaxID=249061 RepID=UPI0028E809AB|nr:membrane protein insertase YidC [uncultured Actinomyces sp.]
MFDAMLHPFAWAISYVWVWIHDLLVLLGMSSGSGIAWVLSIVLLTILVRIAIIPLFLKQIRSSRAMQAIQPEMRKIQEKYKGKKDQVSRQKMMEETQALQRKHKVSPFASCLPMLVQMPVLFGMYRAIIAVSSISAGTYTYRGEATDHLGPLTASVSEEIVNSTVFGVPLSHTLRESFGQPSVVAVFVAAIVLMVALQFFSMRLSFSRNMPDMGDNPMAQSQRTMMYIMPAMFIVSGAFFQMGVVIYTVTASFWALAQSFWTIKVMPTPGSPAYADLLSSRESAYQEWAKPYFQNYDRERAALGTPGSDPRVEELNERTLAEVRAKAKKQHVASDFPASMTPGEIITVYRNLASQKWTTLPDEQWMHGLTLAVEKRVAKQEASAQRAELQKKNRERRVSEREATKASSESRTSTQAAKESSNGSLSAEEIERRRVERRKARRRSGKKR